MICMILGRENFNRVSTLNCSFSLSLDRIKDVIILIKDIEICLAIKEIIPNIIFEIFL